MPSESITINTTIVSDDSIEGTQLDTLERNIEGIIKGALPYFESIFKQLLSSNPSNAMLLYNFLLVEQNEKNVKLSTKTTHIKVIYLFNRFLHFKDFEESTKQDILDYLNSLKKSDIDDPTHKWIGTYNTRQMILTKFFRWLYNKNEGNREKWITPECIQGVKPLSRKEKSPYKPSDIWTNEEHSIFLKYCPEKRDQCYHAMANDTSCRPHELLSIRIGDIKFKVSSTGKQYAEVHIKESKTKPRTLPLIFSVPYIKEWIELHPFANNNNSWLFISLGDRSLGKQLTENGLYRQYIRSYRQKFFPKLLGDPSMEEREKSLIRNLLTKPWNPYIMRHSALTHKSQILKESTLRDHAGWSMTSKMPNVYIHYFGNESSKSLLEAYGIENYSKEQTSFLKNKTCPNCNELYKPEAKFCVKCRMVLSYDSYSEVRNEDKQKIDRLETDMKLLKEGMNKMFLIIQQNPALANIKPEILHQIK
jgi:integrase